MNEIEKAIEGFKIDNVLLFGSNSDEVIERNKLAIQALQAQAERDKMRCENCNWHEKEKYFLDDEIPISEQTCFTCTFYGDDVPVGIPVEESHYCKHFEPKKNGND